MPIVSVPNSTESCVEETRNGDSFVANLTGHGAGIAAMVLAPDDGMVLSCDVCGCVIGWELKNRTVLLRYTVDAEITSISSSESSVWLGEFT